MTTKNRVLVNETIIHDGKFRVREYSTGLLAISDFDAPPAKNNPDEPAAFLRISGFGAIKDNGVRNRFREFLYEVLSKARPEVSVNYTDALYRDFLREILDARDEDPLFRFALFVSGVYDTQRISYDVLHKAAQANRNRLNEVVELNAWPFFLREDIGLITCDSSMRKAVSVEMFQLRNKEIHRRVSHPVWKLALKRYAEGTHTVVLERFLERSHVRDSSGNLVMFDEEFFLTKSEISDFYAIRRELRRNISRDVAVLLSYTYLTYGRDRAYEVALFLLRRAEERTASPAEAYFSWNQMISFRETDPNKFEDVSDGIPDAIEETRLYRALSENEGVPIEWAYEITESDAFG